MHSGPVSAVSLRTPKEGSIIRHMYSRSLCHTMHGFANYWQASRIPWDHNIVNVIGMIWPGLKPKTYPSIQSDALCRPRLQAFENMHIGTSTDLIVPMLEANILKQADN